MASRGRRGRKSTRSTRFNTPTLVVEPVREGGQGDELKDQDTTPSEEVKVRDKNEARAENGGETGPEKQAVGADAGVGGGDMAGDNQPVGGQHHEVEGGESGDGDVGVYDNMYGGDGDLDRAIEEELGDPSKAGKWTIAKEDKLINMFERCTFLYDTNVPEYKLAQKKIQTHIAFGQKLGFDADAIKKRLKTLRTTFSKAKKDEEEAKSGQAPKPLTARKAYLYKRLDFLRPHTITKSTESTFTGDGTGQDDDNSDSDGDDYAVDEDGDGDGENDDPIDREFDEFLTSVNTTDDDVLQKSAGPAQKSISPQSPNKSPVQKKRKVVTSTKSPKKTPPKKSPNKSPPNKSQKNPVPKKGLKTKCTAKSTGKNVSATSQESEERRQTAALESMVEVVKGAVDTKSKEPPIKEKSVLQKWLEVIHGRMLRMDPKTQDEFMHDVDDSSYKAMKKQGKYSQFTRPATSPFFELTGSGNTYVVQSPSPGLSSSPHQFVVPNPPLQQPPQPSPSPSIFSTQSQQQQASSTSSYVPGMNPMQVVASPSTGSPQVSYHTSPRKDGSPVKYLVMGGGGYYHQAGQDM